MNSLVYSFVTTFHVSNYVYMKCKEVEVEMCLERLEVGLERPTLLNAQDTFQLQLLMIMYHYWEYGYLM